MRITRQRCITASIFVVVLTLYLAFPTKDFYWDGVGFALALDHPGRFAMIEPNHPVYIGFGHAVHLLVRTIVPMIGGLSLLQALNSVLGAISAVVVYAIAHELSGNDLDSMLLAGFFAVSATWWKFATELLLPGRQARPVVVAIVHVSAMLFHQLAVMFFVPAVVGILLQGHGVRRVAARNAAVYLTMALILSSIGYYTFFYLATGQTGSGEYWRWITRHSQDSSFSFDVLRNTLLTIRGTARLVLGGRIGAFHAGLAGLVTLLALFVAGIILVWRANSSHDPPPTHTGTGRVFLDMDRGVRWVPLFWLPQNTFYRLFYLPPLALLAGASLIRWSGRRAMYIAVALAGAWNYLFYIHPHSLVESNTVLRAALAMQSAWTPGTPVYPGSFNADNWTALYFNPQVSFRDLNGTRLRRNDSRAENI